MIQIFTRFEKPVVAKTTLIAFFSLFFSLPIFAQADLFDGGFVHDIRLEIKEKNYINLLDSLRILGKDLLVGDATIDGIRYKNVGIGYAQSPAYQSAAARNPFVLKLNFIDKKQNHLGYKTLTLSNSLRDPSFVREVLSYEIMRRYVAAPKANYTNLTINSENRGVYVNIETIDEVFLEKNFGNSEGVFFKCVKENRAPSTLTDCTRAYDALLYDAQPQCYMRQFEMLSKEGWDDLIELTRVLNQEPQNLAKILDIDRTLWFLALQNTLVNLNSYIGEQSTNYFLYKNKTTGLFVFLPTEMHLSFGSLKNIGNTSSLEFDALTNLDPLVNVQSPKHPLIAQLLSNPEYKKIYFSHLRQILSDNFLGSQYQLRADALQKQIKPYYVQDNYKMYTVADFEKSLLSTVGSLTKIPGIVELMSKRTKFLKSQKDLLNLPPEVSDVRVSNREKFKNETVKNFRFKVKVDKFPRKVRLMYRVSGALGNFTELVLNDDGKSDDGEAGDKVFGGTINPLDKFSEIEYYIIAENAAAVSFEPANYMQKCRKISLADLNK
jgi:hypothetical protein